MAFTQIEAAGITSTSTVVLQNVTVAGVITATSGFVGNLTGNVTGTVTGNLNTTGAVNVTGAITVGDKFINSAGVGLGQTTTAGRNIGINTAEGTIIYNSSLREVQVYKGSIGWTNIGDGFINATGGVISDYTSGNTIYRSHIFTSSGTFSVTSAPAGASVEYLIVGGGAAGGGSVDGLGGGGGGGAGAIKYATGQPITSTPGSFLQSSSYFLSTIDISVVINGIPSFSASAFAVVDFPVP